MSYDAETGKTISIFPIADLDLTDCRGSQDLEA
jgi:hypothetical protein